MQAGFHAIGDAAMATLLDGFDAAAAKVGRDAPVPHRPPSRARGDDPRRRNPAPSGLRNRGQRPASLRRRLGRPARHVCGAPRRRARASNEPLRSAAEGGRPPGIRLRRPGHTPGPLGHSARRSISPNTRSTASQSAQPSQPTPAAAGAPSAPTPRRPASYASANQPPTQYGTCPPEDVVVQAADERLSAWSTDPRSGVPGLPDLTPGRPLPDRSAHSGARPDGVRFGAAGGGVGRGRGRRGWRGVGGGMACAWSCGPRAVARVGAGRGAAARSAARWGAARRGGARGARRGAVGRGAVAAQHGRARHSTWSRKRGAARWRAVLQVGRGAVRRSAWSCRRDAAR